MKKRITTISIALLLLLPTMLFSQEAFDRGEWFKFRVHYGPINAGFATLEVKEARMNNNNAFHVVGKGWSTGMLNAVFKVRDNYETYFDKNNGLPFRFIRQIDERGHTRDIQIDFDHNKRTARVLNKKHKTNDTFTIENDVHDMLSAFYYLRNDLNSKPLIVGQEVKLNMFYGDESHEFKLKFLGREVINTKFGKIATLKFRPYVLAGRVFEEKESLTFWVSDDLNKMPVKISANLKVGSLNASLEEFKGLKNPLKIIM
ncbi:DUF3108 domain-containing protein [soil metagenome]